jgi:hypothetical protein
VGVELQTVTTESLDLYGQARLALRLEGDAERIARLVTDVEAGLPLAVWRPDEDDPAAAVVTLYALPGPARVPPRALGGPRRESRWVWPFDADVEGLRNDLENACSRLGQLAVVQREIQYDESRRDWLRGALDLAKRLRATQATYAGDPGEERPEPSPP